MFLKELCPSDIHLGDGCIRLLLDCLVGNTTLRVLCICQNRITPVGLSDITRLQLVSSTRIQTFYLKRNYDTTMATRQFCAALKRNPILQ
jgi:hypothetical protein